MTLQTKEFERRVERLRPLLVQRARNAGLGIEDAEDAVGEAVAKACLAIGRYDDGRGEAGFHAWMQVILDRVVFDMTAKGAREGERTHLDAAHSEARGERGEEHESLEWIELRHELRVRLRSADLTERQRQAVDGWLAGQRQATIAAQMGISQQAVAQHLARGVARLRVAIPPSDTLPDNLRWLARIMGDVVVYRAPLTTGSGLSRERLGRIK